MEQITRTSLLSSGHINAAQTLIRKLFPEIGGLFCTTLGATLSFPKASGQKWLQILHDGYNHSILVAKGFLHTDIVTVYDSLTFRPNERQQVVACMSSLLATKERTFKYHVVLCQKQTNDYACGVYAIAFAVSLAFDLNPSELVYDTKHLRTDLRNCFKINSITPFPSTQNRCKRSAREVVYEAKLN